MKSNLEMATNLITPWIPQVLQITGMLFVGEKIYNYIAPKGIVETKNDLVNKLVVYSLYSKQLHKIPILGPILEKEKNKIEQANLDTALEIAIKRDFENSYECLPEKPVSSEIILKEVKKVKSQLKEPWKVSGAIYHSKEELIKISKQVLELTLLTNPLHADLWPQLNLKKAEIISMVKNLFKGDDQVTGTLTPGGTYSILFSMLAHRKYMYKSKKIVSPNIVCTSDAHVAYHKGADYFNCEIIVVPVDPVTRKVNLETFESCIDSNTVLIVGSSPTYPYGVVDQLQEMSQLALKHGVGFHVDNCLGSFLTPFATENNIDMPEVSFKNLPGMTSCSIDTHKYGDTLKGSSVILFRNSDLKKALTYVNLDWSGGMYVTPGIAGSSPGHVIMTTWSIMVKMGREGYAKQANRIFDLHRDICNQIKEIEGIKLVGKPFPNIIGLQGIDKVNIHAVADKLKEMGWHYNILPDGMHFCLTDAHTAREGFTDEFINDLKKSISYVLKNTEEKVSGSRKMYSGLSEIPSFAFDCITENLGRSYQESIDSIKTEEQILTLYNLRQDKQEEVNKKVVDKNTTHDSTNLKF